MKRMDTERKQEVVTYGILWFVLFAIVPLVMTFRGLSLGMPFRFGTVLEIWLSILPFLVLFLVHDLLVAPLWVEKRKPGAYVIALLVLMVLFGAYVWATRKGPDRMRPTGPPMEMGAPPMGEPPMGKGGPPMRPPDDRGLPMAPEVMKVIMGLLVLGVNLGAKFYLKTVRGERWLKELRVESLGRQLEGLRYQVNPHFFMNTLNNIHALVDLDPEKAKESIEEFSKLMRYILYDGDRPTIPLQRELDYLRHYVSLMRMRYDESVRIETSFPESDAGAEIPPLILASFVENAFKHGISYEKPSFVRIAVTVEDGRISFRCVNSRQAEDSARSHGVGLANVRSRLDLLYGDRYTLNIDENADVYDVLLQLPASAGLKKEER